MGKDLETEKAELVALKAHCSRLRSELSGERALSLRLEDFVRSIETGPCTAMRTGGGYSLDTSAKYEAAALLRAAEAGLPLPPPPGQQDGSNPDGGEGAVQTCYEYPAQAPKSSCRSSEA